MEGVEEIDPNDLVDAAEASAAETHGHTTHSDSLDFKVNSSKQVSANKITPLTLNLNLNLSLNLNLTFIPPPPSPTAPLLG